MRYSWTILLLALVLAACAGSQPEALLQNVRRINPDGTLSAALAEKDLSPFQQFLRQSFMPPRAATPFSGRGTAAQPAEILALEMDVPEGQGNEGDYIEIVRTGQKAELRYFEQEDHRPRTDRYYHRELTGEEWEELAGFLAAHPLAQMRTISAAALAAPATAGAESATEPTTEPAADGSTGGAAQAGILPTGEEARSATEPGAAAAEGAAVEFRLTDARPGQARTLMLESPGPDDHPAADLLQLLRRLREGGSFACTYLRPIPLTAHSLYADPYRKVLWVWDQGGDLRIAVSSPLRPLDHEPEDGAEHWLAYRDGSWEASPAPGEEPVPATEAGADAATEPAMEAAVPAQGGPDTQPATEAATVPATAAATEPAYDDPGMLPTEERWWTQANTNATVVLHYVPLSPMNGVTHGFVVPGLVFDDDHFAVDEPRGLLYLIHDGQLFSLEIPAGARK